MKHTLVVHTDGGARGNPGPAAIGVVVEDGGKRVAGIGKVLGETTNNVAEYTAVIEALRFLVSYVSQLKSKGDSATISFYLDSTLVVNQINGLFKVKQPHLRELLFTVHSLEQQAGGEIHYASIPREQNAAADSLVNQALDGLL